MWAISRLSSCGGFGNSVGRFVAINRSLKLCKSWSFHPVT